MEILNTLLKITVYSGVIYIVILLLEKCLKMSPRLHYALWFLLVVRLLLPFDFASPVHFFVLPDTQEQATVQSVQIQDHAVAAPIYGTADMKDDPQTTAKAAAPAVTPAAKSQAGPSVADVLCIVWLAGMGVCLLYLVILSASLRHSIKKTAEPPSKKLAVLFEAVRAEMGIKRKVRLVCQYGYGAPALMFPRTVLMPIDTLLDMDEEQIKFAISHELTHFKRGDPWMSLALSLINAVYWFNPFVWLAFREMRADMETVCDGAVVEKLDTAQKNRYASFIVHLFAQPARPRYALGMAQGNVRKMAERRVQGIFMEGKSRKSAKTIATAVALTLVIACFTTACAPVTAAEVKVQAASSREPFAVTTAKKISGDAALAAHPTATHKRSVSGSTMRPPVQMDGYTIRQVDGEDLPGVNEISCVKAATAALKTLKAVFGDELKKGDTIYVRYVKLSGMTDNLYIVNVGSPKGDEASIGCMMDSVTGEVTSVSRKVCQNEKIMGLYPDGIDEKTTDTIKKDPKILKAARNLAKKYIAEGKDIQGITAEGVMCDSDESGACAAVGCDICLFSGKSYRIEIAYPSYKIYTMEFPCKTNEYIANDPEYS